MISNEEKESTKLELLKKINKILIKNEIQELNNDLTVLNLSNVVSYLGSIKIFDNSKINIIEKELNEMFKKYGTFTLRTEEVISCCKPPYKNISFKLDINL